MDSIRTQDALRSVIDTAKRDFTVRSGLVPKEVLFEPEQLDEIASDERVSFAVELCEQ